VSNISIAALHILMLPSAPHCSLTPAPQRPVEPLAKVCFSHTTVSLSPSLARLYAIAAPTTPPPITTASALVFIGHSPPYRMYIPDLLRSAAHARVLKGVSTQAPPNRPFSQA